ncbi:MAG: WecB/TagA/CpsF family glycosyltransferase [Microgenomates group bacterium]
MQSNNHLLGIPIPTESKSAIREKIIKNIFETKRFFHVVSLNPEIFVLTTTNGEFKKVVTEAQMRILDGVGVIVAAKLCSIPVGDRYSGVDLMSDLLKEAHNRRLRVLLIGGGDKVADKVIECQKEAFSGIEFTGTTGIANIARPTDVEEAEITSIVAATKPHMVFVAYGSPAQELWIDRHSKLFAGMVVMGVGGAFDFLSGNIARAPKWIQKAGFEWLFRLVRQPRRIWRQLRLVKFMWLVGKEKFQL